MSGAPQFAATPINAAAQLTVANAGRDGTGTVVTLYTAPASGARIDTINIKAGVTTTAGMIRLWLHNGTTFFLWREIVIPAVIASATAPAFEATLNNLRCILSSGWSIRAATEKAELFNLTITEGGVF